ncbi:MAG TPA: nucleotidyltransferase domain-containing protein [Thermoanaerobaculia bacterium]|jgi:hypothetical protein|nr:nucleotidyltransferase domain-containing protein [Thermoanaerobaculia bacterium]
MLPAVIEDNLDQIRSLCVRHRVRSLILFGSAARDDFDSERSDIDFLYEFEADATPGLGGYFDFQHALEEVLGRKVDLVFAAEIRNPYLRKSIFESTVPIYVAA